MFSTLFQSVSTVLLDELRAFGEIASQQRAQLEVSRSAPTIQAARTFLNGAAPSNAVTLPFDIVSFC